MSPFARTAAACLALGGLALQAAPALAAPPPPPDEALAPYQEARILKRVEVDKQVTEQKDGNPKAKAARSLLYKVATLLPQSGIEVDG